jgi:2'-5' RNA ligase
MVSAEGAIDRYRRRLDPSSWFGMPAHVTVLYPFMAPAEISDAVLGELEAVFAACDGFDFTLSEVRWFDDRVVYLAPSPVVAFRALTSAVTAKFPEYPPYEGAFDEVQPHVTVAEDARGVLMRAAGWLVKHRLPITGQVTDVWLMTIGDPEPSYRRAHTIPLRTPGF